MARTIKDAFTGGKAFIPFITAGDPNLEKTAEFILEMERAGADLIEIGIPFSDPIAEGVVIQEADLRALQSGTTTDGIFDMVEKLRQKTDMPLVFMGYLNPVFHYGYDRFFGIASKYGVDVISMIAPTSASRIRSIASEAKGFLYVVSSMGVTGVRSEIKTDLVSILSSVREASDVPAAVGFGINTPEQAAKVAKIADGVIVGSAIVKIVARYGDQAGPYIYEYVKSMKEAVNDY